MKARKHNEGSKKTRIGNLVYYVYDLNSPDSPNGACWSAVFSDLSKHGIDCFNRGMEWPCYETEEQAQNWLNALLAKESGK